MTTLSATILAQDYQFTLTSLRAEILEVFLKCQKPLKAYDIVALVHAQSNRVNIKPITVYRVLDFFIKKNLVHKLQSNSSFFLCKKACCLDASNITVFLICKKCDQVEEIDNADVMQTFSNLLKNNNFKITTNNLELSGFCGLCQ